MKNIFKCSVAETAGKSILVLCALLLTYSLAAYSGNPLVGVRFAVLADPHFEDVYVHPAEGNFLGITNPANQQNAFIRTMNAQVHSTRLFNENYFALLAALDDIARRHIKLVLLPGDLTDDGQPLNVKGLKQVLNQYTQKYQMVFLAIDGNHDIARPYQMESGKTDFMGTDGQSQPVMSKDGLYTSKSPGELPVLTAPELKSMGYAEMAEAYRTYGIMPQKEYLYWETPFTTYSPVDYSFSEAQEASTLEKRSYVNPQISHAIPDISYLVEPVAGLWVMAIDGNVYVPNEKAKDDPLNPANYSGGGGGYNLVLKTKPYLVDWAKRVSQRAKELHKTLIAFSHYPMVDFYDNAAENIGEIFGSGKSLAGRLPGNLVAETFANAGIKVHFGGHLHINDTGTKKTTEGNTLVNIQVPSVSAYPPAYKLGTFESNDQLKIETVVLENVPRFNELFPLYQQEYNRLRQDQTANIWNKELLDAKNYRDFTSRYLKELTRLRYLPEDWPTEVQNQFIKLTGKELLLMALTGNSAPDEKTQKTLKQLKLKDVNIQEFESWTCSDLIFDFYRIHCADRLAVKDIGRKRIKLYEAFFNIILRQQPYETNNNQFYKPLQAFARSFQLLLHGEPADCFTIDLENGVPGKSGQ